MSVGKITAVSLSEHRGTTKSNRDEVFLRECYGVVGDAHAGEWNRQVSLLAEESLARAKDRGEIVVSVNHGENFTTSGIELHTLAVGTRLMLGDQAVLEVTQIGKAIHDSPIFLVVKNHVLPREGVFAKVVRGGTVSPGDAIRVADAR